MTYARKYEHKPIDLLTCARKYEHKPIDMLTCARKYEQKPIDMLTCERKYEHKPIYILTLTHVGKVLTGSANLELLTIEKILMSIFVIGLTRDD